MSANAAKLAEIQAEYDRTQKNKATNSHLGLLKAKMAKIRKEMLDEATGGGGGGGAGGEGFDVKKAGDTRVGLVGFPSVGKSTLLTTLTGTFSEAASYEFTTLTAIPGTLKYRGAKIQVLDLPGIIEGAKDGKGRGRQVISAARTCSMILIVLDCMKPVTHKRLIERELAGFGIRLNQTPPDIVFRKKDKGGVNYQEAVPQTKGLNRDQCTRILKEFRITSADIVMRGDYDADEFIDIINGDCKYMPALYVMNKIDQLTIEELDIIDQMPHHVPISSFHKWNIDMLMEEIWNYLKMMRIYTKPKGQIPDYEEPVVLHATRPTVEDMCNRLHRGIMPQFLHAWVWGSSVKHQPQRVGRTHVLEDEDVIQVVKKV